MNNIIKEILNELESATKKFGKFNSSHEGYAIILEEVDELWDAIKTKGLGFKEQKEECIQIAAMSIRFILDLEEGNYG